MTAALYQKLDGWLDVLNQEVINLRVNQHIFWGVQEIIRQNPVINVPNHYYVWMGDMYASAMSVAIRRQVDPHPDSISFLNLLEAVKNNPTVLSRSQYKSLFVNSQLPAHYQDECYDKFVGPGLNHPDPVEVEKEIQTLKSKTDILRKYVNKRIAHYDKATPKGTPKFQDVDDAIVLLG